MSFVIDIERKEGLTLRTKARQELHKSGDRARDIDDFLDLVSNAWEDYQNRIGRPTSKWTPIKYMRPKEQIELFDRQSDVILFKIIKRQRFNTSPDGTRRPRTPAIKEQIEDPSDSSNLITYLSQKRENIVKFEIWSVHSKQANILALDFERFMQAYDWYFTSKGINRVWFEDRQEDRIEVIGATEWSIRPLQFLVITELIYQEISRKLSKILIRFDAGSKLKSEEINAATGLIEHSIDRGPTNN